MKTKAAVRIISGLGEELKIKKETGQLGSLLKKENLEVMN